MNIYTHPKEIKEISKRLTWAALIAYTPPTNYYMIDGKIYSVFHEGLGSYPELVNNIPSNAKYNQFA